MKKMLYAVITCVMLVACGLNAPAPEIPTFDPGALETAIVSTALAAQSQTQSASIFATQAFPTFSPTSTLLAAEAPVYPLSLTYEGMTTTCSCDNCGCVTSIVITARLTVDAQGYVIGEVDKYLSHTPPLKFEGTLDRIYGLLQRENDETANRKEEKIEFLGSIKPNFSMLECTILASGRYYSNEQYFSAKRTALLFRIK